MASLVKSALLLSGRNGCNGRSLLSASAGALSAVQQRAIMGKTMRGNVERPAKRPPFDYNNKFYTLWNTLWDRTTKRFDENSKMIVVEGPIGVGKDKFARELAEELEMKYYPEPTMDLYYINDYGHDLRELDPLVPEITRTYDHTNFCRNPNHPNAAGFQLCTLHCRFGQYIDAVAHLLNTGQGVVLQRSPFSDFVFLEAMYASGYVSKNARSCYYIQKANAFNELVKPHLVIYLDIAVKEVQDRIRKRALPYEKDSKVFTDLYLSTMEKEYKQTYLPDMEKNCELLVYDWTGGGEAEIVVEDIERMDFDKYSFNDIKLKDWRYMREVDWADFRQVYTNQKDRMMNYFNVPYLEAPELIIQPEDYKAWYEKVYSSPTYKWDYGFNKELGDTGIMWKSVRYKEKWGRNL